MVLATASISFVVSVLARLSERVYCIVPELSSHTSFVLKLASLAESVVSTTFLPLTVNSFLDSEALTKVPLLPEVWMTATQLQC